MPVRLTTSRRPPRLPPPPRLARAFALIEKSNLKGKHSWRIRSVATSVDGTIASASSDGTICLWDEKTGIGHTRLSGHVGAVESVLFVENRGVMISGGADRTLRVWNIKDSIGGACEPIVVVYAHQGDVCALASNRAARVVSGSADKCLKLWSLDDAGGLAEERKLIGHSDAVTGVAYDPDGEVVVSSSYDATVRLWSATQGTELRNLVHPLPVTALAISPDGKVIASGANDGTLRIWSGLDGRQLMELEQAHTDKVASLCFVDATCVASGGRDDHVRLHAVVTGKQLAASKSHVDCVVSLAMAFDGSFLASGSHDQTVRTWRLHPS